MKHLFTPGNQTRVTRLEAITENKMVKMHFSAGQMAR